MNEVEVVATAVRRRMVSAPHSDLSALVDAEIQSGRSGGVADDTVDREGLARLVLDELTGLGPLQPFLDDPLVEEIWWNRPDRIFVSRGGTTELSPVTLRAEQVAHLVERMLRESGRRLDLSQPFVDAPLPDGGRLHVAIPPITSSHWAVNIRRYALRPTHLDDLVVTGTLPGEASAILAQHVRAGRTVVVAGATAAGKTTLLNALLGSVPADERIVSCEEVFEIRVDHADWVAMQTRSAGIEGSGEIRLRDLVRESLRMRPSRLVVGEVRQAEALDLLLAANSGVGSLSTIHANSCREAVLKLCTLPLLAGPNISADFVRATVAACVQVVVHVRRHRDGRRRVGQIVVTTGRVVDGEVEIVTEWEEPDSWA